MKITHRKLTEAQVPVECGALAAISKYIKNFSQSLWGNLTKLVSEGINVTKSEAGKDGVFYMRATSKGGNKFIIKCTPVGNRGKTLIDLSFGDANGRLKGDDRLGVKYEDLAKEIADWANKHFDEDNDELDELYDEDLEDEENGAQPDNSNQQSADNQSTDSAEHVDQTQTEGA